MKKLHLLIISALSLGFFACDDFSNLGVPESLTIKQKANYEFSLGGSSFLINEKLDSESLQNTLNDENSESTLSVYDYNPTESDDAVQQYILNYQIEGIQLGLTADSDISTIEFDTKFEAPDFSSQIASNLTLTGHTFPAIEPGTSASLPETEFYFNITSPTFSTMLIRSGTLEVTVSTSDSVTSGFVMNASITLTDADENVIAGPSDPQNLASGGTVSLDLAGKTLVQNMKIFVTADLSGGTLGTEHTYSVEASPNNIKFDTIKGLTMSASDLGANATIEIEKDFELNGINNSLKSATIKDGSLSFSCSYPEGWSGIVVDEDHFVLYGGIELDENDFEKKTDDPAYILYEYSDLKNKSVKPAKVYTFDNSGSTTEKSYISFHLENATIVFADTANGEKDEIVLNGSCDIKEIDNLVVDVSKLGELNTGTDNEIDTGISFGSLLSNLLDNEDDEVSKLLDNIEFSDISGCLLMTYPDSCSNALESIAFSGSVTATYDGASTPVELLNESNISMKRSETILLSYVEKTEKTDSKGNVVKDDDGNIEYKEWIGSKGAAFIESTKAAELTHMTDLLNARPDNLKITYNLGLSSGTATEVTLTGDDVKALTESTSSINISLVMILPLKIALIDNFDYPSTSRQNDGFITIDNVLKLADKELEDDILKREDGEDDDKISKYTNSTQSVGLKYSIENSTGLVLSAYFEDDKIFNGTLFEPKALKVGETNATLEFSKEEIQKIFSSESYPFTPRVKLEIEAPGSSEPITVTRNAYFGISANIFIKTDGSIEVFNKND
ncbi:MAG: hypothetical protein II821_06420 [Treponema sp.]|nr:hypothetical protein [Treponema sp.]